MDQPQSNTTTKSLPTLSPYTSTSITGLTLLISIISLFLSSKQLFQRKVIKHRYSISTCIQCAIVFWSIRSILEFALECYKLTETFTPQQPRFYLDLVSNCTKCLALLFFNVLLVQSYRLRSLRLSGYVEFALVLCAICLFAFNIGSSMMMILSSYLCGNSIADPYAFCSNVAILWGRSVNIGRLIEVLGHFLFQTILGIPLIYHLKNSKDYLICRSRERTYSIRYSTDLQTMARLSKRTQSSDRTQSTVSIEGKHEKDSSIISRYRSLMIRYLIIWQILTFITAILNGVNFIAGKMDVYSSHSVELNDRLVLMVYEIGYLLTTVELLLYTRFLAANLEILKFKNRI